MEEGRQLCCVNRREIDPKFKGDPPNPKLDFFILPERMADHYWAKVEGYRNTLLDYYIEAVDKHGSVSKSDIFHVWVGSGPP